MKRREVLKQSALAAVGVIAMPLLTNAFQLQNTISGGAKLSLDTRISANHGHQIDLSLDDTILLLRQTHGQGSVEINIQGQSRHPHVLQMDEASLLALLLGEMVELVSSNDAGHSHLVHLSLQPNSSFNEA